MLSVLFVEGVFVSVLLDDVVPVLGAAGVFVSLVVVEVVPVVAAADGFDVADGVGSAEVADELGPHCGAGAE